VGRNEVSPRNRTRHGWWIATCLERFEYYDENRRNLNRRCLAWENTILIKARNREEAWRKAVAQGRLSEGSEAWDSETGRKGAWHFEGLTSLLPVYDRLEDGAEIIWVEHAGRTVRRIRGLVKKKHELEAFADVAARARSTKKRRFNNKLQQTRRG
jgi:Domain of unknown function (DUF4288)